MAAPDPWLPCPGVVRYGVLGRTREDELSATADWYRQRNEPEEQIRGTITRRETGPTPGGRDRLLVELVCRDGRVLPIYGPPAEAVLLASVDRIVEISGKLIDQRGEGGELELWVADGSAVQPVPPDLTQPRPG